MRQTRLMIRLILPALAVLLSVQTQAQITLNLSGADASAYPTIKVFFEARDRNAAQIRSFVPSDFTVVEDGITRPVLSVSCPPPTTPPLSLTLTVDISYSMSIAGRLNNAKTAASVLVRSLNFPPAQVGITTFTDDSFITLPFSGDTTQILSSIASLTTVSRSGTDFLGACLDPTTGALDFTKNRTGDRYIIFITDGAQNLLAADEQRIITAAVAANLRIYTVTLSPFIQNFSLRRIATGTGGLWFEDITTEQAAIDAFKRIGDRLYTYAPCELTYVTSGCETRRNVDVTLRKLSSTATKSLQYLVPAGAIVSLESSNLLLDYGVVGAGSSRPLNVTITARNGAVNVTGLSTSHPAYQITSFGGSAPPFTLAANESRVLRIQYTASDTSKLVAQLNVQCNAPCVNPPVLSAGSYKPDALRLVQPNGGEVLYVASSYMIRWAGIAPNQQVILEYSTDAGATWYQISPNAYSLASNWVVPNTPSPNCLGLVRTPEKRATNKDAIWLPWQPEEVVDLDIAAGGALCATAQGDGHVKVFAPDNSVLIDMLAGHTGRATAVAFSPDGSLLASGGSDGRVKIWSTASGALLRDLAHGGTVHSLAFARDGATLASTDGGAVVLWRTSDWSEAWRRNGATGTDGALCISPKNAWVASATGSQIAILRFTDGSTMQTLSGHGGAVRALSITAGGQMLASGSDDRSIILWKTATWQNTATLSGHTGAVTSVQLSPSGLYCLSSSRDRSVRIWDTRRALATQTFTGHTLDVNAARTDARSGLTLSGGLDRTIRAWGYSLPLDDMSDSLWAIIAPNTTLRVDPPAFTTVLCPGEYSESEIFFKNTGNQPLTMQTATFSGSPAFSFAPGYSLPPARVLQPEDTLRLRVRFYPASPGDHQGTITFTTDAPTMATFDVPLLGHKDSAGFFALPDTIDTGELYACTLPAVFSIELTNAGTVNLRIDSLDAAFTGSMQLEPTLPHPLLAGEIDTLTLSLRPGQLGPFVGRLILGAPTCDVRDTIVLTGSLVATRPVLTPDPVAFGFTTVGDTSQQAASLRNPTRAPMTIDTITIDNTEFFITSPTAFPLVIPPLDSIPVSLSFAPVTEGTAFARLTAYSSAPCADTVQVGVRGSAARKPAIAFRGGEFETLLCPDRLFTDSIVVLRNTGGVALLVSNMDIRGTHAGDFSILTSTTGTIAPGDSMTVRIRFEPKGTGLRTATLRVTNNSSQLPQLDISLVGRKDSAGFVIDPPSIDAGVVHVCDLPVIRKVVFRNTGTVPLSIDLVAGSLPAFARIENPPPLSLRNNDTLEVFVRFLPTQFGPAAGVARFSASPCGETAALALALVYEPSTPLARPAPVDFGSLGVGVRQTRRTYVVNPASVPMRVTTLDLLPLPGPTLRRVQPATLPATIAGRDSLLVEYEYAPTADELITATLHVVTDLPCTDSVRLAVRATGVGALSLITLPTLSAEIGTRVRIPVTLATSSNLALTSTHSPRAQIVWNRSMLWPISVNANAGTATMTSQAEGDSLVVTVDVQQTGTPANGALAEIECLVLLGTNDSTALTLRSFAWTAGTAAVQTSNGVFTALGICDQGGQRLMSMSNLVKLFGNTPNPFNPETVIEYELPDEMYADLRVFDGLGHEVAMLATGVHTRGRHRAVFHGDGLASGTLFAVLRAAGVTRLLPMLLAK
ncbi:MAG: choice-of-anchor D domain-containing protein [Ignavibacteriae bacterium]|nr:choice-of-anchor D domain-containing protein [Ignavibacteriota bacterium]